MAIALKNLGQVNLTVATQTVYTVPASTTTAVRDMMICNVDSSARTVTVWLDHDGTTANDTTAILDAVTIPANDFIHWSGFQVMVATATIKAACSSDNTITITVAGLEQT